VRVEALGELDAIIAWPREGMDRDRFHSSDGVHHPEIDLQGFDRARGVRVFEDRVVDMQHDVVISDADFDHDRYEKREDRGWIEHTGDERVCEQIACRKDRPSLRLTASMWKTGRASAIRA
jgi:hypothetical protein